LHEKNEEKLPLEKQDLNAKFFAKIVFRWVKIVCKTNGRLIFKDEEF